MTLIDEAMPGWDFDEVHETSVAAPPADAFAAVREVSTREVRLLGPLMSVRLVPALVRHPREMGGRVLSGLRGRGRRPVIDEFLDFGFVELGTRDGEELVWGAVGRFWRPAGSPPIPIADRDAFIAFEEPGYAKAALNFTVAPDGGGSLVRTETRVLTTSPGARRSFAIYWRLVMPGSAVIRRSWLGAIRRRAEREAERASGPTR